MSEEFEASLEARIVADDLQRLADKLQRIAAAQVAAPPARPGRAGSAARSYVGVAQRIYSDRRIRSQFLPGELFADPAWDILLDLYIQADAGREVSVTSACVASDVPHTTALRWLALLEEHQLIERHAAVHDKRVHYVRLTKVGVRKIQRFLEATERQADVDSNAFLLRAK